MPVGAKTVSDVQSNLTTQKSASDFSFDPANTSITHVSPYPAYIVVYLVQVFATLQYFRSSVFT